MRKITFSYFINHYIIPPRVVIKASWRTVVVAVVAVVAAALASSFVRTPDGASVARLPTAACCAKYACCPTCGIIQYGALRSARWLVARLER